MRFFRHSIGLSLVCAVSAWGCGGSAPVVEPPDETDTGHPPLDHETSNLSAIQDFDEAVAMWSSPTPNYQQVEALLEDVVDKDPSLARAWFNLGVVREELGDEEGAIEAYRQSNAADTAFVDGLANIGALMLKDGEEAQAEQLFMQVVAADEFHPTANLNLAQLHRDRSHQGGDVNRDEADQAINRVRLALAGNSNNVDAYETMAAVYHDLGRYQLARLVCLNAIELGLESASLHNRLGLILLAEGNVTGAYAEFRVAVNQDESLVEASMNQGAIALNYRDYMTARDSFERVLRYDTDNVDAQIARAVSLRGLEDMAGAEAGYRTVLDADPNNLAALYNMGILFQEYQQNYSEAKSWFERYLGVDSNSGRAEDVRQRVQVLTELIELLGDTGGAVQQEEEPPAEEEPPPEEPPVNEAPPEEPPMDQPQGDAPTDEATP